MDWTPTQRTRYRDVMVRRLHMAKQWLDQATKEHDEALREHFYASKALDDFDEEG